MTPTRNASIHGRFRPALALAAALAAPLCPSLCQATEGAGTVVPIGVQTIMSGSLQDPGDYLLNYNQWVRANKLAGDDGLDSLPSFKLRVQAHAFRYLHVFDGVTLLGATPAFEVAIAYVDSQVGSAYFSGKDKAFGDTSFGPSLGWHSENLQQMVSALVVAPTGSYKSTQTVNVGRNYYALQLDYAVSGFVARGLELSAMNKLILNRRNPDTHYRSGTELDIDFAANQHLPGGYFVGVGGYWHKQLTDDRVDGVSYQGGYRINDLALGPQAGWGTKSYGAYLAWQKQIHATNAADGSLLWLNMFVKF